MTFGNWTENLHNDQAQQKRMVSAQSANATPSCVDKDCQTAIFPGSGAVPYSTTLNSCTCVDFARRRLPCKHIYRLAIELGLLDLSAKSGINKNALIASQISLSDAVAEVENMSDDSQLFIKNLPQTEPVIFSIDENDQELLSCAILSTSPLEPRLIMEQMSKKEIMEVLANNGYIQEKNMLKDDLISWCIQNVTDIKSILPEIVHLSASPHAKKIWRKLYKYLRRKYDWEHFYLESEARGMEEFFIPAEAEKATRYATSSVHNSAFFFPDDEITDLLTLYGHNRCLNGFVIDKQNLPYGNSKKLDRKNFAITGAFDNITRAELSATIQNHGGRVNEWITKNTAYLIVGNNAGVKRQKAEAKGIPLLSLQDFYSLIGTD